MALEIDVNTNGSRFFATNTNWSLDIIITNGIESCDFITDLLILEIAAEIPFYTPNLGGSNRDTNSMGFLTLNEICILIVLYPKTGKIYTKK